MVDIRQTQNYAQYMSMIGWSVKEVNNNFVYIKNLPVLGGLAKLQRPNSRIPESEIHKIIKQHRVFSFNIEPLTESDEKYYIDELGFKKIKSASIPSKTIHIDLSLSQKKLLNNMHYKTRYNIGLAKRRGVVISLSKDVTGFVKFWNKSARSRGMFIPFKKEIFEIYNAFGKDAEIINAQLSDEILSTILVLYTSDTGYYMYAASTKKGNKNQAPTLLAWEAIIRSKNKGKKIFDFEGIFDERYPIKTWKGFTRFKKSFGGQMIEYPGIVRKLSFPLIGSL